MLPQEGLDRVHLEGYGGDEMLNALRGTINGTTLTIEGDLPFILGDTRRQSRGFSSPGGITISGGNISIGGGSVHISGGGTTIINGVIFMDGQKIDLDRKILLVLMVPIKMDIQVRKVLGVVGISDFLDGQLNVKSSGVTNTFANGVRSYKGNLSGDVETHLGTVKEDFDADLSGSGVITAGVVGGRFRTNISGSASVTVNGGSSQSASVHISGSGRVIHRGIVIGDADIDISGSAQAHLETVRGDVEPDISGSGFAVVNGKTYQMRRGVRW